MWKFLKLNIMNIKWETLTKFSEEVAFRHLGHVILMEILTVITLLTQVSNPVFAHYTSTRFGVSVGTITTSNTTASPIELTQT